jgi:hypothetical protein
VKNDTLKFNFYIQIIFTPKFSVSNITQKYSYFIYVQIYSCLSTSYSNEYMVLKRGHFGK